MRLFLPSEFLPVIYIDNFTMRMTGTLILLVLTSLMPRSAVRAQESVPAHQHEHMPGMEHGTTQQKKTPPSELIEQIRAPRRSGHRRRLSTRAPGLRLHVADSQALDPYGLKDDIFHAVRNQHSALERGIRINQNL
jgi:hypothetical protein